ncbi:LACT-domain-containing protein [Polychaeton citri CBS 116435]|uniref:LACT-domain-containing protein n=1 Tax=Polychaeton citri CBS 116435 TaxID=1314669 RepID=A0A9P4Q5F2_9PEZI|nr:LACT-domain-containing protein [Polychaeton citri CBS 116435]
MSTLRRRVFGGITGESTPESSRDPSPAPAAPSPKGDGEDYRIVSAKRLERLNSKGKQKSTRNRNAWVFVLGGLAGIILAGFFAKDTTTVRDLVDLAGLRDMNLDSFLDVLPAGLIKDVQDMQSHEKQAVNYDSFSVGLHARSQGIAAKHSVIMIPGVISTGLESWGTEDDSRQYFRKRLWGSWSMMRALVLDKPSWKRHIMLDKYTGLDPPGVKLRAAQGFDAADFFITGYWIWNKILENLATIGYDPTNAFTASYDWRLSYDKYEIRDQYFTRLKTHIELANKISGLKIALLSHSMGSQVLYYFFHWVESMEEGHGKGGPNWVNDHVESWINISGCMLGALKGVPAILSGEMKDTAQLNAFAVYGLEKFLSRYERAEIFRAMPGISSMLPMGGDAVWGNETWAPDDPVNANKTYGTFMNFRQLYKEGNITSEEKSLLPKEGNLTVQQTLPYIFSQAGDWYADAIKHAYSYGVAKSRDEVERNQKIQSKWINPLETRLPLAPKMKIYCFYGVGKETERAYYYREERDLSNPNRTFVSLDTDYSNPDENIDHGVRLSEGDGTVNLLSLGYMCSKGWKMKRYNPAGIPITVHEMPHEPDAFSPRGGPNTGDHVDILGRSGLNDLILRVAGGRGDLVEESIISNIREYAEKVRIYDDDE